jgi:hypothetical protein
MEVKSCRDLLLSPYVHEKTIPEVVHHLRRILEILKLVRGFLSFFLFYLSFFLAILSFLALWLTE